MDMRRFLSLSDAAASATSRAGGASMVIGTPDAEAAGLPADGPAVDDSARASGELAAGAAEAAVAAAASRSA